MYSLNMCEYIRRNTSVNLYFRVCFVAEYVHKYTHMHMHTYENMNKSV